ncbi:MAG TPA: SagB family peptide dehydrogenase [Candidatus Nanopelagicales bacterium]|nr:SagB family peptide dehydrogenase [Candidatus Nanopelagicales bacterium]
MPSAPPPPPAGQLDPGTALRRAPGGVLVALHRGEPIAALIPISERHELSTPPIQPEAAYRLSRFCYLRRDEHGMLAESPLAHAVIRLLGRHSVDLAHALAEPRSPVRLALLLPELSREEIVALLSVFVGTRMASACDRGGTPEVDAGPALSPWSFHDLLFHSRSRAGRHGYPIGATYPLGRAPPPVPAVKPPMSPVVLPLPRPSLARLADHDTTLTRALEERRSIREDAAPPITAAALGEFMYRVARVRSIREEGGVEITSRPYPSAGACYALELYLNVDRCDGLLRGLYHYNPLEHGLEPLSPPTPDTERQLAEGWAYTARRCRPQILVTITARFQRVAWKYESIAYATILKDVGVLYQTMYLVATAMGLGPCALGCGDADRFSRMIAEDYQAESSVGEFILGGRPT